MNQPEPAFTSSPAEEKRHYILGTAGHIDHGKTALVKALSGTDTDRLPEERRRGMTIELGFANLTLGPLQFGIVDVPGHERFVRTMVAGATGIDIALIVIAADDSVMPQTREHVDILHLLGVSRAVVAVTKIDVVEADMVELVVEEIEEFLAATPLAEAPICPVSSITGDGLSALKETIVKVAAGIESSKSDRPFRMAVDRVFSVPGRGTVVTGSVLRGEVVEGDTLEVWPSGESCRVRGLQTHGAPSGSIVRGQRAAINQRKLHISHQPLHQDNGDKETKRIGDEFGQDEGTSRDGRRHDPGRRTRLLFADNGTLDDDNNGKYGKLSHQLHKNADVFYRAA
ncbi:MAG: selenocysteine-specific translation elongation factor [Planctomycetes bacterium]|nr:selenocysteine-specific translation elongation factor [Planctomycetota bacterium]